MSANVNNSNILKEMWFSFFIPFFRCVSKDQMFSRDTWKILRKLPRQSTRMGGCTPETLENGFLYVVLDSAIDPRSLFLGRFDTWWQSISCIHDFSLCFSPGSSQSGTLKIIDRKKHIFKLAQGEYIAPEKIETAYSLSDPVAQIFVYGESLQVTHLKLV